MIHGHPSLSMHVDGAQDFIYFSFISTAVTRGILYNTKKREFYRF